MLDFRSRAFRATWLPFFRPGFPRIIWVRERSAACSGFGDAAPRGIRMGALLRRSVGPSRVCTLAFPNSFMRHLRQISDDLKRVDTYEFAWLPVSALVWIWF